MDLLPLLALTTLATLTTLTTVTTATAVPAVPAVPSVPATPVEAPLDMSPDSFDDRYLGCDRAMAAALPALNRSELRGPWAEAWALAMAEWRVRRSPAVSPLSPAVSPAVSPLSPAQAVALLAYTAPLPLHRTFNAAVRSSGRSGREYREQFPFKTLHFLLTTALATLRDAGGQRCHRAFRGVRGVRLRARPGQRVRFGHFASASLRRESARSFGSDTWIQVSTCHGAPIRDFSFFPHEEEVLIPPFETFQVTNVTNVTRGTGGTDGTGATAGTVGIELRSAGTYSRYNCEWLRDQRCGDGPCVFDTGHSIPRAPSDLGGLLLATTALAVATGAL